MRRKPMTRHAHDRIGPALFPGANAVDATAGNGHDTLFLARAVGAGGHVYALDIQPRALQATRRRLEAAGLLQRVHLIEHDHAEMRTALGFELEGRVSAVVFNLGYLPGCSEGLRTTPATTIQALTQATRLLAPGGILSILAYTAHTGGALEARAVEEWCSNLGSAFDSTEVRPPGTPEHAPRLYLARRVP